MKRVAPPEDLPPLLTERAAGKQDVESEVILDMGMDFERWFFLGSSSSSEIDDRDIRQQTGFQNSRIRSWISMGKSSKSPIRGQLLGI